MVTPKACSPPGESTGTTPTPTSAPRERAPVTTSGRVSTGRARITRTPRSSPHKCASGDRSTISIPHAQRIMEAKQAGAKLIVLDVRLSNTATHADHWLSPYPGSEAAIYLSIANHLIQKGIYDREFVSRWWNWREYLAQEHPELEETFEVFEAMLKELYKDFTFEFAAAESGIAPEVLEEVAEIVATAGTRLSTHSWRSAAAGNLGGWQVARTLFLLNALLGAIATSGGTYPNAWHKFVPAPIYSPPHPHTWNELTWPLEYPLGVERA